MEAVQYWLMFVAFLRSISVVVGYVGPSSYQRSLFTTAPSQVTPLAARTFAIWTSITCTLCLVCAFHLRERGIVLATAASFYAAAFYFSYELLISKTATLKDWGVIISVVVAGQRRSPQPSTSAVVSAYRLSRCSDSLFPPPRCCPCRV
jgi:uncharacterized membrane protein